MFDDGVSEVVQLTNGVRCHRCGDALMIVSRLFDQTGFIARDNDTWRGQSGHSTEKLPSEQMPKQTPPSDFCPNPARGGTTLA